jgi:hypothetical protein
MLTLQQVVVFLAIPLQHLSKNQTYEQYYVVVKYQKWYVLVPIEISHNNN